MTLAQQRDDAALNLRHRLGRFRLHHDHPHRTQKGRAKHLALRRTERNDHGIVLVPAIQVLPLAAQHANHGKRILLNAHRLANRVFIAKKVLRHGLANQGNTRR